ncbi:type II secretion system protein GspM [Xanthomonas massiliensis]|uniref:type II secretion system protein GspM n=1 Tax=Xanthomonas massiliensis TaxID=1720302 RepID=UPI0008254C0B|nr:type II secretion system protein GspM [Xanthomonas massiliensis]
MATPVPERERWLALGLLLAVLALAYLTTVHPAFTVPLRTADAEIAALQARQQRMQAQLDQAGAVAAALAGTRRALDGQPGFLPETSAELASAALVQRLEAAVATASPGNRSCQVSNRSPLPPEQRERFTRVAVQVRLRCGTPELAQVLYALEGGTPRLFVDDLNVLAVRGAGGGPGRTEDGGLDAEFVLAGYLAPAAAPAPVPPGGDDHAP